MRMLGWPRWRPAWNTTASSTCPGLYRLRPSVSPPAVPIHRRPGDAKDASGVIPKWVYLDTTSLEIGVRVL